MSKFFLRILNIAVFFYLIIQTNSYAGATFVQTMNPNPTDYLATGIEFSKDGLRLTIGFQAVESWRNNGGEEGDLGGRDYIRTFTLTTAFDISTANRGDRVKIKNADTCGDAFQQNIDMEFSNDGLKAFTTNQHDGGNAYDVCQITLSTAYDITTASSYTGIRLDDGDTDVGQSVQEAMGVTFNKDGTKMFVGYNNSSNTAQGSDPAWLYEFDLTTGFDVDTAKYNNVFIDLRSIGVNELTGMKFSPDGKTLFVLDPDQEVIHQFSLSKSFDLSSTFSSQGTFNDVVSVHDADVGRTTSRLYDLTFNNDGSKVYIAMGKFGGTGAQANILDSRVHEYDLDCAYGLVRCDPLNDKALMGVIEAQMELSKSVIKYSTLTSLHRIEWIRRNKKNDNLTNQNIKFHFSNKMLESLSKAIPASLKKKSDETTSSNDWHLWSEGDISFGKAGDGLLSLEKRIDTKGITIGADKINEKKNVTGFSLRFGDDHVKVGSSKAYLDQNSYSFMFYNSINQNENKYVDSVIGISTLNIDQKRYFNSWNQGQRNGKQFFGTVKLANSNEKKQFYEKYVKITFGLTKLSEFTETGTDAQIRFEKQTIHNLMTSSGLRLQNINEFQNSTLKIFGLLEHMLDLSPSNSMRLTYNDGSSHNLNFGPSSVQNIKGGLGIDLTTGSGLSVVLNYARDQSIMNDSLNSGHSDDISIAIGYVPVNGTNLVLTSNEKGNALANLNIVKNINGYDIYLNSDYDLFLDERDLYIGINKIF